VRTGAGGKWSVAQKPIRTATYRAAYAGNDEYAAASSPTRSVHVRYRLNLVDISGTASHTAAIVATGKLSPADAGTEVTVHRVDASGHRHTVATTRTKTGGHWKATWRMARGKHLIVATVAATTNDYAASSRVVTVKRT
jgi:hypothetical protein